MILYVLNLFDFITTLLALGMGGVEMNPVVRFLIGIHPAVFAFVKIVPMFFLCRTLRPNLAAMLSVIVGCVVVNNIYIILLLGGLL